MRHLPKVRHLPVRSAEPTASRPCSWRVRRKDGGPGRVAGSRHDFYRWELSTFRNQLLRYTPSTYIPQRTVEVVIWPELALS